MPLREIPPPSGDIFPPPRETRPPAPHHRAPQDRLSPPLPLSSTSPANAVHHVAWIPIQPAVRHGQVPPPIVATTRTTTCPVVVACGCLAHRRPQTYLQVQKS
ncbi:uncharacterized protein [Triticum aestivum]|uniref:uncharacterized protein n=1 Tax=Triticum aestivum TaxID=4565 RepID=UPI001D006987|nr:uncharacterized protein LOC123162375 [Triticum aestivum]